MDYNVLLSRSLFLPFQFCLDLHSKGVIHRDIKPDNILFGEGNVFLSSLMVNRISTIFLCRVKIAPLDVARIKSENTLAITTVGPLPYMAPEQFRGEGNSFPVDIWALGVIAYEMCTLKHPFIIGSHDEAGIMYNILYTTPPPIPQFGTHFSYGCFTFSIYYLFHLCYILFHSIILFVSSSIQSILCQSMYTHNAHVRERPTETCECE